LIFLLHLNLPSVESSFFFPHFFENVCKFLLKQHPDTTDFARSVPYVFNIQPCFQQFVERKTVGNTIVFPAFHKLQKYFPFRCENHPLFFGFQLVVENRVEIFLKAVDNEKCISKQVLQILRICKL